MVYSTAAVREEKILLDSESVWTREEKTMKSRTKNRLSEEKIRELVRIHFGQDCETGEITELTGGMFNAIYRIEREREKRTQSY